MAVEKKVSSAKSASKKVVAKKSSNSPVEGNPERFDVGIGQQRVLSFTLTPKLPVNGKVVRWPLVFNGTELKDGIAVSFDGNSKEPDRSFERAVLVINLDAESIKRKNGHWRFALNGVITDKPDSDVDHDIGVDITNGGTTLVAFVHSTHDGKTESINFGYVANYTDPNTNQIFTYESADPDIKVGRPV